MKWKNVLLASSVLLNVVLVVSLMMPGRAPDFGTPAFGQNRAVSGGGSRRDHGDHHQRAAGRSTSSTTPRSG